jgi:subtilisin family serine protease
MANDEDMSLLHKKGIQVESAEPPLTGLGPVLDAKTAEDDLPAHQSKRSDPDLKRRFAKLELHTPPPIPEQKSDWYRLSFHGILTRYRRERLSELAIDLSAGYRKGFYQVFLTPNQLDELKKESFVKELRRYDLRDTVSSSLLATLEEADEQAEVQAISEASLTTLSSVHAAAPVLYAFDIIAHRASDLPVILEVLKKEEASGTPIEIVGESPAAIRIRAPLSDDLLVRIALLTEVRMITPYKPPRLTSDQARKIIGVTRINPTASNQSFGKWTGRGERIAVLDSGICQSHPDFQGRLFLIQGFDGCSGDDEVGHGTHVAGIIAGNCQA